MPPLRTLAPPGGPQGLTPAQVPESTLVCHSINMQVESEIESYLFQPPGQMQVRRGALIPWPRPPPSRPMQRNNANENPSCISAYRSPLVTSHLRIDRQASFLLSLPPPRQITPPPHSTSSISTTTTTTARYRRWDRRLQLSRSMRYRTSSLLLRPLRTKPSTDSRRIQEAACPPLEESVPFGGLDPFKLGGVTKIPAPVYHARSALVSNSRYRPPLSCKGTFRCAAISLCLSLAISHCPHPFHDVIPDLSLYQISMKALFHLVWFFLTIFVFLSLSLVLPL